MYHKLGMRAHCGALCRRPAAPARFRASATARAPPAAAAAAAGAAGGTSASRLTPRQRKLAAKKQAKEDLRRQQQQQQQQQVVPPSWRESSSRNSSSTTTTTTTTTISSSPAAVPVVPQHLLSLSDCVAGVQNRSSAVASELAALSPDEALSLVLAWADQSRALDAAATAAAAAGPASALLPSLRRGAADGFGRQQLADAAWALAHFDPPAGGAARLAAEFEEAMCVPFRVVPRALPGLRLEDFLEELRPALRRDTIYLDGGARAVEEARLTGWQSDIGASFKYSGKEMRPAPGAAGALTPRVATVRDALVAITGQRYDSVLINLYEDGKAGMRFHVDPLYGAWTPETAVVSLGAARRFVFREAGDHSARWSYRVGGGDAVAMFGDCQDRLQHAVAVERRASDASCRVSLVFKQRARGPDGVGYAGM